MPKKPPFSRTKLLQCDRLQLYHMIAWLALQFAILGHTDLAKRLISKINGYDYFHGQHVILRPLYLLWNMLGPWPDGEEERVYKSIAEERERDAGNAGGKEENKRAGKLSKVQVQGQPVTRSDVQAEVEKLASSWAQSWYRPNRPCAKLGRRGSGQGNKQTVQEASELTPAQVHKAIKQILDAVDRMEPKDHKDAKTGVLAMDASSGLVHALDLRLLLEERGGDAKGQEDLPSTEVLLGMIAKRLNANQQVNYLAQSRRAWKILANGALAKVLGVDLAKLNAFAKEAEEVVDERFSNGRLEPAESTIYELLQKMEHNSRTNPDDHEGSLDVRFADKTLFRDPATTQQIEETEKRLGIQLSSDYKEFTSITNGFGAAFSGFSFEPPLHPLSDLRWLDDEEDYFTDLALDIPGDMLTSIKPRDENSEVDWVQVGKAIEVGTEDIDNQWLIPPSRMNEVKTKVRKILDSDKFDDTAKRSVRHTVESFAGSVEKFWGLEWGFLTWAAGGSACMVSYPSFKAYLNDVAERGVKNVGDLLSERKFFGYAMLREDSTAEPEEDSRYMT